MESSYHVAFLGLGQVSALVVGAGRATGWPTLCCEAGAATRHRVAVCKIGDNKLIKNCHQNSERPHKAVVTSGRPGVALAAPMLSLAAMRVD